MPKYDQGQGLAEYTLIALLALLVCIPAIGLFGGDFLNVLKGLFVGMNQSVVAQATPLTQAQVTMSGDKAATALSNLKAVNIQLKLKDGTVINLKNYPQDLKQYVEATGSNGATTVLLAQMDTLIQQLKAKNALSTSQVTYLQQLSSQGYRLADIEAVIEKTYQTSSTGNNIYGTPVSLGGQTYLLGDLAYMLGWHGNLTSGVQSQPDSITNPLSAANAGTELEKFLNAYFQAEASGALTDPALNHVVSDLSSRIAFLTEVMEHAAWEVDTSASDPSLFNTLQVSNLTYYSSSQLCQVGSNPSSTVQCEQLQTLN